MKTRRFAIGLATVILAAGAGGAFVKSAPQASRAGADSIRRVEKMGFKLDVDKPTYKQATVRLRVTDGDGAPVNCQMTLEMVPVFDEGMAVRLSSSTCPPHVKTAQIKPA